MTSIYQMLEDELSKLRDEIELLEAANHATIAAIVATVGGEVEGHPTSSINYLQRLRAMLAEIERLKAEKEQPYLGLATTRELLDELRARIEMHALGGLDYRTVDGETFAKTATALEPKP